MKIYFLSVLITIFIVCENLSAQEEPIWKYDLGFSFFKSSLNNQPDELLYNPVFMRWEAINQQMDKYEVSDYKPLEPYPFNLSVGVDVFFRYKKYFMIKLGYCYTNTLGIGSKGHIKYIDKSTKVVFSESKEMSFISHQINYFIGPALPIGDNGAEIFMGFSIMSPTYVSYNEKYSKSETGVVTRDYNKTFSGFFGNCRSMIGIQVPVSEQLRLGTEIIFAYLNGLELKSGDITDESFKFPEMQWNFTIRYNIK